MFVLPPVADAVAITWLLGSGLASKWTARGEILRDLAQYLRDLTSYMRNQRWRNFAQKMFGRLPVYIDRSETLEGQQVDVVTEWMQAYASRRLGIAGLLQAAPQAFFHLYIILLCHAQKHQCVARGHHRPALLPLLMAISLDAACLALTVYPAMKSCYLLVDNFLTWGRWGALLREAVDCCLYVADIGTDIYFIVVSGESRVLP